MDEQLLTATNWMNQDSMKEAEIFEYTLKSIQKLQNTIMNPSYDMNSTEIIYHFLEKEAESYNVSDYLKRYIYIAAQIEEPFNEVPTDVYQDIILDSFEENETPFSMTPIKRRKSAVIKEWFNHKTMQRDTIFLLGFGLKMSRVDVSLFLRKVIKEYDFNYYDYREVIFAYCYENDLDYSSALKWMEFYDNISESSSFVRGDGASGGNIYDKQNQLFFRNMEKNPEVYLFQESRLKEYLQFLKKMSLMDHFQEISYNKFVNLLETCLHIAFQDVDKGESKKNTDSISYGEFERIIYAGVPITDKGNMTKVSRSKLGDLFEMYRFTRQRMDNLMKKKLKVNRYDLLTLHFFIYAKTVEIEWPSERYFAFINKTNELLNECGMFGIYPVNPYESFLLLCMYTEDPLATFSEVWELSYE